MGLEIWVVRLGHVGFLGADVLGSRTDWGGVLVNYSDSLGAGHVARVVVGRLVYVAMGHRSCVVIGIRVMRSWASLLECSSDILELIDNNLVLHRLIFLPQIRQLSFQLGNIILLLVQD